MVLGYELFGWDNNSHMTGSCDKLFSELTDIPKCNVCGYRTDYRYHNPNFKLRRKAYDYSSTYDGITIVSNAFKEFCEENKYDNLEFIALPKALGFFQFNVNGNLIEYTAHRKENLCTTCGFYESVVGPTINLEKINNPLKDGFYQSDLWFASGNEKSPIFLIAADTFKKLKEKKFKGTGGAQAIKTK